MYQNYHHNGNHFDITYENMDTARDMAKLNSAISRSIIDMLDKVTGEILFTYDSGLLIYQSKTAWTCPVCDLSCPYCTKNGYCKLENPIEDCDEWGF